MIKEAQEKKEKEIEFLTKNYQNPSKKPRKKNAKLQKSFITILPAYALNFPERLKFTKAIKKEEK